MSIYPYYYPYYYPYSTYFHPDSALPPSRSRVRSEDPAWLLILLPPEQPPRQC